MASYADNAGEKAAMIDTTGFGNGKVTLDLAGAVAKAHALRRAGYQAIKVRDLLTKENYNPATIRMIKAAMWRAERGLHS